MNDISTTNHAGHLDDVTLRGWLERGCVGPDALDQHLNGCEQCADRAVALDSGSDDGRPDVASELAIALSPPNDLTERLRIRMFASISPLTHPRVPRSSTIAACHRRPGVPSWPNR